MTDTPQAVAQMDDPIEDIAGACAFAKCGPRPIYHAVKTGKLRAAAINARGDLRFRRSWLLAWLDSLAKGGES